MSQSEKHFLRTTLRKRITLLSPTEKKKEDDIILAKLFASEEYRQAQTIFAFVSMPHEINTLPLLEKILQEGKTLAVPLCLTDGKMEARIISSLKDLHRNAYGIMEPDKESPLLEKERIDLAIVPCLAATSDGYRLGYGGGYYDRYFASYLPRAVLLCRQRCLLKDIPKEQHDIRIPMVITERKTYH